MRNLTLQRDFEDKSEHVKRYLDNLTLTTIKHGALTLLDSAEDKLDSEKAIYIEKVKEELKVKAEKEEFIQKINKIKAELKVTPEVEPILGHLERELKRI